MPAPSLQIVGRKFRVVPEKEYQTLCASLRDQRRQAKQDAADLAAAERRIKSPRRKSIPVSQLKSDPML